MTVYSGMDKAERNRIIEQRCRDYGIAPVYSQDGRAGYVPDIEDKVLFYENCENPELREAIGNALTAAMGDPFGDDSWTEIF